MRVGLDGTKDVLELVVRRKWWVVLPFVALSCAAGVLTYILPRTFMSETLILVRPRDVPEDFVKDLTAGSPEERLKAIEQTILSRTNLIEILKEFGDRLPEFERLNIEQKVLKLREQIKIDFSLEKGNSKGSPTDLLSDFVSKPESRIGSKDRGQADHFIHRAGQSGSRNPGVWHDGVSFFGIGQSFRTTP